MKVLFTLFLDFKGLTGTFNIRNYEILAFMLFKLVILKGNLGNVIKGENVVIS
jgi:hypothetical protein